MGNLEKNYLFNVHTPLGFAVHVTKEYWDVIISEKHPVMRGAENKVKEALRDADQIRRSKSDLDVYLIYKKERKNRWTCAVAKRISQSEGFLITAYPTDSIKEGEEIWKK